MGPTVWELEGPIPVLKRSNRLVCMNEIRPSQAKRVAATSGITQIPKAQDLIMLMACSTVSALPQIQRSARRNTIHSANRRISRIELSQNVLPGIPFANHSFQGPPLRGQPI